MRKLLYWFLFSITYMLSLFPLRALYWLSDMISFIFMKVFGYRRSVIYTNLARSFPDLKYKEIKVIAKEFQRNLIDIFIEAIWSTSKSRKRINSRVNISRESVIRMNEGLKDKGDVLLVMGHQANWEMLSAFYYTPEGEGMTFVAKGFVSVYQKQSSGSADSLMKYIRSRHGIQLVESGEILRHIIRNKGGNKIYLFIADQSPAQASGEKFVVDFLHQKTQMLKGPEYVARKFGIPAYYLDMRRVGRGRYAIEVIPISMEPADTAEGYITSEFARLLQKSIENDKSTWLWSHKRWKFHVE